MNYWNEINKLQKENMEINEQIDVLMAEQDRLYMHYRGEVFRNPEIRKRYYELEDNLDMLTSLRHENEMIIEELRTEYRESHARDEYFRNLDEIDIRDIIGRDGFIIAVKF